LYTGRIKGIQTLKDSQGRRVQKVSFENVR
jgi:hypothetical protein